MAKATIKKHIWNLALLAFFGIALYPILPSGFYSDDLFFSQGTAGQMEWENMNLLELAQHDTKEWMQNGRLAPLFYLTQRALFYYCDNVVAYKAVIYTLNLLAVAAFGWLLLALTNSRKFALLVLLLLPAFFQFRVFHHDAYTTFNGMYQSIAIMCFAAMAMFTTYLRQGNRWYLVGTTALMLLGFLYSEITICFIPLFLLLAYAIPKAKPKVATVAKQLLPLALIAGIYLGTTLYLRGNMPSPEWQYKGLKTSFEPDLMLKVLHGQVFSTIPLIYLNYEVNFMKNEPIQIMAEMYRYAAPLLFCLLLACYCLLYHKTRVLPSGPPQVPMKYLFWLGLLLLLLPAAPIMISEKYQLNARPGNGYLPVYLQNFGAAILWGIAIYALLESRVKTKRFVGYFLILVFMLVVGITFAANTRAVAIQNRQFYNPTKALEKAIDEGLLDGLANKDVLWLGQNYHWQATKHYEHFFYHKTGLKLWVANTVLPTDSHLLSKRVFYLSFPPSEPNEVELKLLTGFDGDTPLFEGENKRILYP